ncbi:hypothetical protein WAI453_011747 [Rhynchosporium graminicola]
MWRGRTSQQVPGDAVKAPSITFSYTVSSRAKHDTVRRAGVRRPSLASVIACPIQPNSTQPNPTPPLRQSSSAIPTEQYKSSRVESRIL